MDYLVLRVLSSFLAGLILSQTGSFIQMGTRNILASPSTLGFDGLAILWFLIFHSLSVFFGWDSYPISTLLFVGLPLFAILGFSFSKMLGVKTKFEKIILLGLTFNLLVGAIFSLWQFLFLAFNLPFPMELWFGHFRFVELQGLGFLIATEALILLGLFKWKRELLLFSLGPGISKNWNLNEKSLYRFLFVSVAIGTLVVVSLFGAFSFLALIFPVIARKLWFKSYGLKGEILLGSVVSGFFLMLIDLLCYFSPILGAEVPVGLIMTGVGAVSLILLLWQSQTNGNIGKS